LVNAGNYHLPSYDAGVALEGRFGAFSLNAVGMNINENDDGYNYNFWGVEAGWHPEFKLGAGNYRILVAGTSSAFLSPSSYTQPDPNAEEDQELVLVDGSPMVEEAGKREALLSWGLSFDQAIGESLGVFLRLTWQDTAAAVDYEALYSGGVNIKGNAWNRPGDNIGLGYAYLEGGNTDVRNTNVFEGYYRAALNEYFAITADLQYMNDGLVQVAPDQNDPEGWIFGLRLTAAF
jgi:porin